MEFRRVPRVLKEVLWKFSKNEKSLEWCEKTIQRGFLGGHFFLGAPVGVTVRSRLGVMVLAKNREKKGPALPKGLLKNPLTRVFLVDKSL